MIALLLPPLLLAGCAFGPGEGFGRVEEATLTAVFSPGERDLGAGEVLTDAGYAVRIDRLALEVEAIELLAATAGGVSFDPTNPPEGYTGCHGGHCHGPDGTLVDYAEIEAAMGEEGALAAVATLPVEAEIDLLAGATLDLDVSGAGQLPGGEIEEIEVAVHRVVIEGVARRDPDDGWSAPVLVDLTLHEEEGHEEGHEDEAHDEEGHDEEGHEEEGDEHVAVETHLHAEVHLPLGRDEDPNVSLAVVIERDGALFDGLDLFALAGAEGIGMEHLDDAGAVALVEAVLAVEPAVTVERAR